MDWQVRVRRKKPETANSPPVTFVRAENYLAVSTSAFGVALYFTFGKTWRIITQLKDKVRLDSDSDPVFLSDT